MISHRISFLTICDDQFEPQVMKMPRRLVKKRKNMRLTMLFLLPLCYKVCYDWHNRFFRISFVLEKIRRNNK